MDFFLLFESVWLNQSCWRNEGSMDRDKERGRGLGLNEFFFPESSRSSNSSRYFKFRKNSNSILPSSFPKIISIAWSSSSVVFGIFWKHLGTHLDPKFVEGCHPPHPLPPPTPLPPHPHSCPKVRAFKRLWSPGINSEECISPAYVARAGIFKESMGARNQGSPPGYIGLQNSFLGIDSGAP